MNSLPTDNVLDAIVAHKWKEVAQRKQQYPLMDWVASVNRAPVPACLEQAIQTHHQSKAGTERPACILEIKPASPSAGILQAQMDLPPLLDLYQRYGMAISVLTDAKYFGGSLALLQQVSERVAVPTLCKDFIVDAYQVYEARKAGAQAVLLIVKALEDATLQALFQLIVSLGMTPLIEVQDALEVERALRVQPSILLINNRNLQTLELDLSTTERLAPLIPKGILKISASGIQSKADLVRLMPCCDGFLIGSTLMKQPHSAALEQKLRVLLS